jgi:hypothetical protein
MARATGGVGAILAALMAMACASEDSAGTTGSGASGTTTGGGGSSTATTSSAETQASASATSSASGAGGGAAVDIGGFTKDAASAVCGALFRCCDPGSVRAFFEPLAADERLKGFASKLPPQATIDSEGACATLLGEMYGVAPFGDWLAQVAKGQVAFLPKAFDACVGELGSAACGLPVTAALYDGTCFGFAAPSGGAEQRSMFARSGDAGAACSPIKDGIGSSFYGTCDPTKAFCCYDDPAKPGACGFPFEGDGTPRAGTCKAVSAVGAPCDALKNIQLCKTGDTCDGKTGKCVAEKSGTLAKGQTCIDASYNLLGDCQDSYCDVLGTKKCEPLKATGAKCDGHDQCESGSCESFACAPLSFCKG